MRGEAREPYYSDGQVTIYHGRCEEVLPALGLQADLAVVDQPYGDTSLGWDRLDAVGWVTPVRDALALNGSLWAWGSMRMWLHVGMLRGFSFSQDLVWEKHNGSGSAADRFRRVHEHALLFYRGQWGDAYHDPQFSADATRRAVRRKQRPPHWGEIDGHHYVSEDGGPRLARSVIYERSAHGSAIHPTQKPLGMTSWMVAYSCPPAGLVLDPFMGSGTTLLAARDLGRRAVGIDIDESYCESAATRLASALPLGAA